MTPAHRFLMMVLAVVLGLTAGAAWAAPGLSVSPVTLEFDTRGAVRALEVSNPGDAPTDVQIRLFAWSVVDGQDQTTPSGDIGFSPPMFHLEPGAKQVVRFAAVAPNPTGTGGVASERAYRLFVDQLPGAPEPGKLQMPVRMVLPLFIEPNGSVRGDGRPSGPRALRWKATFDTEHHRARLIAINDGARRLKLQDLAYEQDGKSHVIAQGLAGYVLAGQQRTWDFDYSGPPGALVLRAGSDQGDVVAQTSPASG